MGEDDVGDSAVADEAGTFIRAISTLAGGVPATLGSLVAVEDSVLVRIPAERVVGHAAHSHSQPHLP
jgi:hypothetical protein